MNILVFRLSAMGDVALTLPVIRGVVNANSETNITIVTKPFFRPFFENLEKIKVITPDFAGRHKGFFGVIRLFFDIRKTGHFDWVIDLHSVIRTRILTFLFRLFAQNTCTVFKNRKEKKQFLTKSDEPKLDHTIQRYEKVFTTAGFEVEPFAPPVFSFSNESVSQVKKYLLENKLDRKILIGIAPYAKHKLKIWPEKYLRELLQKLSIDTGIKILLFGGGKSEIEKLNRLSDEFDTCHLVNLDLRSELALISKLRLMISMDSSNMHIAALSGVSVISVWGATHPGMGFSPYNQPEQNIIQISVEELTCRPCTIYGKGKCSRGDFACMERILPERVYERVQAILNEK